MSSADLPVAAPDPAETMRRFANDTDPTGEVVAALDALLAERQQDKERIERLETALERIASVPSGAWTHEGRDAVDSLKSWARAALAVEEDTRPGKPETPGNSGAAVEEDAHG